jgi:hypothetical protein
VKQKIAISIFIAVILIVSNINSLNAKVNDKKETKSHPNDKNGESSPSNKGGKSGKNPKNPSGPEPLEPILPPDEVFEVDLDFYADDECTIQVSNVSWGEVSVGGSKTIVLFMKNSGKMDTVASLATDNWYPENAVEYMSVSWDYSGHIISPGELVSVAITLDVSPDCPPLNEFNFKIVIISS